MAFSTADSIAGSLASSARSASFGTTKAVSADHATTLAAALPPLTKLISPTKEPGRSKATGSPSSRTLASPPAIKINSGAGASWAAREAPAGSSRHSPIRRNRLN